jgi:hypothetical protein
MIGVESSFLLFFISEMKAFPESSPTLRSRMTRCGKNSFLKKKSIASEADSKVSILEGLNISYAATCDISWSSLLALIKAISYESCKPLLN